MRTVRGLRLGGLLGVPVEAEHNVLCAHGDVLVHDRTTAHLLGRVPLSR